MERLKSILKQVVKWALFVIGLPLMAVSFALSDIVPLWGVLGTCLGFMALLASVGMSDFYKQYHED